MKKQEIPSHKKFFFDVHNFDENENAGDAVEDVPPPPTFSEQELAAAQAESRATGHKEGYAEAQASVEKQILDTLSVIRSNFSLLFEEESRRAQVFEKEAVQLATTIFARAFPALNKQHGMNEVKAMLESVLETVREMPEIAIDIPPEYVEPIQTHINGLLQQNSGPRCIVRGNDSLGPGQCHMVWLNGTAARNGAALAEQIRGQIAQVLADEPILTDNGGADTQIAPMQTENSHE